MIRHRIIGLSVFVLTTLPALAAAQAVPTMNQPDNGFFEGPDPEWAMKHSTDTDGTAEHRQYHRDGVRAHLVWHDEHRSEQGTAAYLDAHRVFHQERNAQHRHFHTVTVDPLTQ